MSFAKNSVQIIFSLFTDLQITDNTFFTATVSDRET